MFQLGSKLLWKACNNFFWVFLLLLHSFLNLSCFSMDDEVGEWKLVFSALTRNSRRQLLAVCLFSQSEEVRGAVVEVLLFLLDRIQHQIIEARQDWRGAAKLNSISSRFHFAGGLVEPIGTHREVKELLLGWCRLDEKRQIDVTIGMSESKKVLRAGFPWIWLLPCPIEESLTWWSQRTPPGDTDCYRWFSRSCPVRWLPWGQWSAAGAKCNIKKC